MVYIYIQYYGVCTRGYVSFTTFAFFESSSPRSIYYSIKYNEVYRHGSCRLIGILYMTIIYNNAYRGKIKISLIYPGNDP